jgi:hypothetical protein
MFFIPVVNDHAFTPTLKSVNAIVAFRSAPEESRAPEWKTGVAVFICGIGMVL